jgi:hypothetical protein
MTFSRSDANPDAYRILYRKNRSGSVSQHDVLRDSRSWLATMAVIF